MPETPSIPTIAPPAHRFPVIRHLSWRLTSILVRLPITPNQITVASMGLGAVAAWLFSRGTAGGDVAGGIVFFLTELLVHCDGEVARAKRLESSLGDKLSELSGFVIHTLLLLALGRNGYVTFGSEIWLWMSYVAALGATINYLLNALRQEHRSDHASPTGDLAHTIRPEDVAGERRLGEQLVYVLRELVDADFCFLMLLLGLAGVPWLLLPPAAVGAHAFWIAGLAENARRYRA